MENEISIGDILAIRDKLKVFDKNWATDLSVKMQSDFPGIKATRVYNIVSGRVYHQQNRRSFVVHSEKLLLEYQRRQEKAANKVDQLLEAKVA